jgi:anhydro-N-acetylmuramic acid kinase
MHQAVIAAADMEKLSVDQAMALDNLLGRYIGRTARSYIRKLEKDKIQIDLVASHGQTIRHLPKQVSKGKLSASLQIGAPARIAHETGLVTVADFRQADIAAGGEGAPITTGGLFRLLEHAREPRSSHDSKLIVNIGGMSNFFYYPSGKTIKHACVADCGPGNVLSDLLARKLFGAPYDKSGKLAAKGSVSSRLMAMLTAHPFFKNKQLSTGREEFGERLAGRVISFGRRFNTDRHDLLATVVELTAQSITHKVKHIVKRDKKLTRLYLTGGGRRNNYMVSRLSRHLSGIEIRKIDAIGVDGDLVEAASYAVMGEATLRSDSLGRNGVITGAIFQPPRV